MIERQTGQLIFSGGRALDPAQGIDDKRDVLVEHGLISAVDKPGAFSGLQDAQTVDASGLLLVPGLIDIHVHLREPGFEHKENVETGSKSAASAGVTAVCCMPNTEPAIDTPEVAQLIVEQAKTRGSCRVHPIGAITLGREGRVLAPLRELRDAGCVAFSDDGSPVWDPLIMRRALECALELDAILAVHEEELALSKGSSMNESALSRELGLIGMPGAAEDVMIARDIELARLTGGRVHFCHVSTARAVTLIRRAKEDGLPVTAEVAPHHFALDESRVGSRDTSAKMSMPLRSKEDVAGVLQGLAEGVIDCIATDHAPHEQESKDVEFENASFGIIGYPTLVPLTLAQVRAGKLTLPRAIEALTSAPARCFQMEPAALTRGSKADLTLIDESRSITLCKEHLLSKSSNSPFMGEELQGLAVKTFVNGSLTFDIAEISTKDSC